jgi:hypothetical protein
MPDGSAVFAAPFWRCPLRKPLRFSHARPPRAPWRSLHP